jgi:hypothetical protein
MERYWRHHFFHTMERVRTAKEEKHYFPKASNQPAMIEQPIRLTRARSVRILTQHLYDLRFSRRFVLVRVAYLSSSEAYTYNLGVFGAKGKKFERNLNG